MIAARPAMQAKTRTCPHCKAIILESASVCPGCQHHLRFGTEAQHAVKTRTAWRVEGTLTPPGEDRLSEYSIVITVRNERNEEVNRQVVNVGALQGEERRTFTLSVEMSPPQPLRSPKRFG